MPKLYFSGNRPNTIRNNILKLPVIPAGAFSIIQDGVQLGRQFCQPVQSTVLRSAVPDSRFKTTLFRYQRLVQLYIMSQYELKGVTDLS